MIEIRNLNKTFHLKTGDVTAVKDVNLSIEEGQIYGIIGYSGAGKSTLVRCLNLLEVPDSGYININGVEIFNSKELADGSFTPMPLKGKELNNVRKGIGMIFQQFNLLDRSTVFDNIAYPLKYTGRTKQEIKDRVFELLDLVDLRDKAYVYPSQLSGGQKQRVAIARAIADNPKVLLSDEATSALDPEATESILQLLKDLNEKLGITILLITHEMSIIKSAADRVAVMENGRIVEENDTYSIFSNPRAEITKNFIRSSSAIENLPSVLKANASLAKAANEGRLIMLTFNNDYVGKAVISLLSRDLNVDINIALANTDVLKKGSLGTMICEIEGSKTQLEKVVPFLDEHDIKVEVIRNA